MDRTHRQYSRVEPENRLVARELETQWNVALQTLSDLKGAYAQAQTQLLAPLSSTDRELIKRLVEDLPGVWYAPTTMPADQKRMLRCLIQDVSLDSFSQAGQTCIHIRWQTGAVTNLTVSRPTAADSHRLDASIVVIIRELAQTHSDDRIAELLNQRGLKTRHGFPWSYRRVMDTRRRHHIPTTCPITPRDSQPRGDGLISVKTAAQQLHTSPNTINLWAHKGVLYSEHKEGVCPLWVRVTPEDIVRLTQSVAPPDSLRIQQACRMLQVDEPQFWEDVRAGQCTVYRVREGKHWEFRVIIHPNTGSKSLCISQHIQGAL